MALRCQTRLCFVLAYIPETVPRAGTHENAALILKTGLWQPRTVHEEGAVAVEP